MLLWLWRRLVATALICPLAWELPYAMGAALKIQKSGGGVDVQRLVVILLLTTVMVGFLFGL